MSLPEAIKAIRKERGISQAEMARRLDMERGNYPRLENRDNKLTLEQVEKIAGALGVGLIELLTWGEEKPEPGKSDATLAAENEQLKKRVAELEGWAELFQEMLKGKDQTISSQNEKIEAFQSFVTEWLSGLVEQWAYNNDAGTVTGMDIDKEEPYMLSMADWKRRYSKEEIVATMHTFYGKTYSIDLKYRERVKAVQWILKTYPDLPLHIFFFNTKDKSLFKVYYALITRGLNREPSKQGQAEIDKYDLFGSDDELDTE